MPMNTFPTVGPEKLTGRMRFRTKTVLFWSWTETEVETVRVHHFKSSIGSHESKSKHFRWRRFSTDDLKHQASFVIVP